MHDQWSCAGLPNLVLNDLAPKNRDLKEQRLSFFGGPMNRSPSRHGTAESKAQTTFVAKSIGHVVAARQFD